MRKYSLKTLIITAIICSVIFSGIDDLYILADEVKNSSNMKKVVVASNVDGYGAKSFNVTSLIPEYATLTSDNFAIVIRGSYEKNRWLQRWNSRNII